MNKCLLVLHTHSSQVLFSTWRKHDTQHNTLHCFSNAGCFLFSPSVLSLSLCVFYFNMLFNPLTFLIFSFSFHFSFVFFFNPFKYNKYSPVHTWEYTTTVYLRNNNKKKKGEKTLCHILLYFFVHLFLTLSIFPAFSLFVNNKKKFQTIWNEMHWQRE